MRSESQIKFKRARVAPAPPAPSHPAPPAAPRQPWRAFRPDGVILFSDILTPISGMNIPFDITAGQGPVIFDPVRTQAQVDAITELKPEEAVPFVGEALRRLRAEVGNEAAVLGFVGAPFTLATYIVEGGMSKNYTAIKRLMFSQPEVLHGLLSKLADAVTTYIIYQADAGACAAGGLRVWGGRAHAVSTILGCRELQQGRL